MALKEDVVRAESGTGGDAHGEPRSKCERVPAGEWVVGERSRRGNLSHIRRTAAHPQPDFGQALLRGLGNVQVIQNLVQTTVFGQPVQNRSGGLLGSHVHHCFRQGQYSRS